MVFLKNHLFNASPWWKTHGALRLKKRQISAAKTFVAATRGRTAARPPRGCKWWKLRCLSTNDRRSGAPKNEIQKTRIPKGFTPKSPRIYVLNWGSHAATNFLPQRQSVGSVGSKVSTVDWWRDFFLEKLDDDFLKGGPECNFFVYQKSRAQDLDYILGCRQEIV